MSTSSRPPLSPAVLNCWTAYQQVYATERGKGTDDDQAYESGKMAYRQAMPCFSDRASIRDFIACVTHGMVLRLIPNEDGTKLLYAANIAAGSFRREAEEARQSGNATQPKDANSDSSSVREAA